MRPESMKRITQPTFGEPEDRALEEEALVVHQRSSPTDNRRLVVLVHGLGGSRYGARSTWGSLPSFLFHDLGDVDIGLYSYVTMFRRLKFWRSISLDHEAEVFAQILRDDLADYQSIVLVGHSMGGLLSKAAIAKLLDTREHSPIARLSGLILMATPQLGSSWLPSWLPGVTSDIRALRSNSELVQRTNEKFQDYLYLDESIDVPDRFTLPTWAVLGATDLWVHPLSAGIGLASKRKKVVRGSHTEIVKPRDAQSDVYLWVRDKIQTAFSRYRYDVFLAAPMAALTDEESYSRYRNSALSIEQALLQYCGCRSVFFAGRNLERIADFEAQDQSLGDDYQALKESRYFLLFYPEKRLSSVIYEAGIALALGKPSVYFVDETAHLPYLMQRAEQAFVQVRIKIHDHCGTVDKVLQRIRQTGRRLFTPEEPGE